ncbi:MAG: M28 family metallopeptidase [Saprospiraceae bacterium]|nr:M28 family metallopeptidase [Saprospiraceae bacterium]
MVKIFSFLICLLVLSCHDPSLTEKLSIDETQMDAVLSEISSDHYLGRKPFTEGEVRTINFLQKQFEELGVEPGNHGSYVQEVPLVEITGSPEELMHFDKNGRSIDLTLKERFVSYTIREQEDIVIEDSEVLFCGYGIVAPEYNWNDFEGVDVKGKTIIVLVNDPGFGGEDDSFFKGNTMTYYGRWTYKYEEAARQGAEAVLIVHETASAGYPWFVVSGSWSGGKLNLQSADGNLDKPGVQGWISLDAAKDLFDAAGKDLGKEIRLARTHDFKPFAMDMTMSHKLHNSFKEDVSHNVIGMIKGQERPDETIIYSAHWDHLGVGQAVNGDSIYNGALDNGSGIASLLSIAKSMSERPALGRSVVFLFVTAEEQGLLGSQYYAQHPIFPVDLTVANLNMDGMNQLGPMKYLTVTGIGHSDMDEYAAVEAAKQGREVLPDPEPEKGYFFRSDHFNFAKVGIPALYAEGGLEHMEKGREFVKEGKDDYTANRYHQPSDHYNAEDWDLGGLVQDAELYLEVGLRLANETTFPQWKDGSEFKGIREKSTHKN